MTQKEQPSVLVHLDERDGGSRIATITINNARKLNTLNSALMKAFAAICEDLAHDQALRR